MTLVTAGGAPIVRLLIAIPCQDQVDAGFALDLARLVASVEASGMAWTVAQNRGTIIPQQRHTLVLAAQEWGATHLLWLDSDMRFPADTVKRLLAHQQPIVAANYSRRRHPVLPTAEGGTGLYLFTTPDSTGLVEVQQCGMGVMLVDMAVFAAIPTPWFVVGFNPKDGEYYGEDFFFCHRATTHGFATRIDQDLSQQVQHVGTMAYTPAHACFTRDAYAETP